MSTIDSESHNANDSNDDDEDNRVSYASNNIIVIERKKNYPVIFPP